MSKRFFTPIDFTNTVASAGGAAEALERQAQWDYGDGTLQIGLAGNNVKLSVGQEEVVRAYNGTGSALSIGQAVYVSGAQGQRPSVRLAVAVSDETSSKVLGLVAEAIANGAEGFVTTRGVLKNVNTASFIEGSKLWLSPTSSGAMTASAPSAPNHSVFIGYSLKSNANSGEIFVAPQNGYEIDELHNVLISSPSGSQVLYYDSSSAIWRNTDITNLLPPSAGGSSASTGTGSIVYNTSPTLGGTVLASNLSLSGDLTASSGTTTLGATKMSSASISGSAVATQDWVQAQGYSTGGSGATSSIQYSTASLQNGSTTTFQKPTGMTGISITSGVLYKYEIGIWYRVLSTNQVFKSRLNYPTLTQGTAQTVIGTNTTQTSYLGGDLTLTGTQIEISSTTTTNSGATLLLQRTDGFILPSANGTFSYEFAPATSSAVVFQNSYMLVTPVTAV